MADLTQQREQHTAEAQGQVQEATDAAHHAQAAEAETKAAAEKVTTVFTSLQAVDSAKAATLAAAQQAQNVLKQLNEALSTAKDDRVANAKQYVQSLKGHISEAVKTEVTAATQRFHPEWKSQQAVAAEVRCVLGAVATEIKSSIATETKASMAKIDSFVETAVAAAAMQSLAVPSQAGPFQVKLPVTLLCTQHC